VNAVANDTTIDPGIDERIVASLLEKGRLKDADLARARRLQEEAGGSLLSLLSRLGLVSERDHAETVASVLELPLVSAKDAPELPPEGVVHHEQVHEAVPRLPGRPKPSAAWTC
jgi:general secretion pathway protein E